MVPQTKVFVGSLPPGSKPEELRNIFERYGVVTECDIMNRCGFVHMQTEEQASSAIRGLHNSTFNGGIITVERGRIKERGQRGGGIGGRGGRGMGRGGRGGGPMRGGGHSRDAPYMRDTRGMRGGRGGAGGGGGYERPPPAYDDRYNGYGGEDRRGFALREPYPMYEERRYDEMAPMYGDRRGVFDEREMLERRRPPPYERAPPRPMHAPNGDMYSRRSPMHAAPAMGGYDRDPYYAQQYPPMGRGGGGASGGHDHGGAGPVGRYM